ncbi:ABC transporter substrate-binding protein [Bermanella sp. R86510]|uniref:ABC transporter substrate-binding protein n=1 Tax=unclassified Bermanella TaxID=2627862 RepID=UPI0037CC2CA8
MQLKWDHQFQFAGFYAAISQGYYEDAGYSVTLIPRINKDYSFKDVFSQLKSGNADFAVGGPDVLTLLDKGEDVVVVASLYQNSPYGYIFLQSSNIENITDVQKSCLSSSHDFGELELKSLMLNEGLDPNSLNIKDYQFGLASLIDNSCEVVIDYLISAYWAAKEKKLDIEHISASDYGIHFYGDTLFTLKSTVDRDPEMVNEFQQATVKGWQYALQNQEEISRYIADNYARVLKFSDPYEYNVFSAKYIKDLMNYPVTHVGHSSSHRWQRIQDHLTDLGVVESRKLPDWFLFDYRDILESQQSKKYSITIILALILFILVVSLVYFNFRKTKKEKEYIQERQYLNEKNETIQSANDKLSVLIDSSPDIVIYREYQGSDLKDTTFNKWFERWVGLNAEEIKSLKHIEDLPERVISVLEQYDEQLIREKDRTSYQANSELADGRKVSLDIVKVPVFDSDENLVGILFSGRDVTETTEIQSLYKALFSLSQDPFFVIDELGAISSCNEAAVKVLKLDNHNSLIGMRLIEHFTPEYQPDGTPSRVLVDKVNQEMEAGLKKQLSFEFTHQDINENPVHVNVFIVRIDGGAKKHLLVQWHDIGAMINRQNALKQAKRKAEELTKEKSMFLANMSHEIRTPLNAVLGLSQMLLNKKNVQKHEEYISSIYSAGKHLRNVVDDILDYSKIEAGRVSLEEVEVDLNELVSQVDSLYQPRAVEIGIELIVKSRVENAETDGWVYIDPVRYNQIINNLLSNALKFTKHGTVELTIYQVQSDLVLEVKDSGIGISEAQIKRLFEPFSQADVSTTRKYGGTGLGLTICRGLAESMGGSIEIESEKGKGSRFVVTIPYKPCHAIDVKNSKLEIPNLKGKRMLIAEDNALNQMVIEGLLEETQAQCEFVDDGRKAVEILKESDFDLVLMDLQMPEMDGYEATEVIRDQLKLTIPIVALTANTSREDRDRCLNLGMVDFLTKPIDGARLFEVLTRFFCK